MRKNIKYLLSVIFLMASMFLVGCQELEVSNQDFQADSSLQVQNQTDSRVVEGEYYYDVDDVAAYIHKYNELPDNYITKSEAEQMNWSTDDPIYVVGGDRFANREGLLPKASGRKYYEADVASGYTNHRGPERLVYSNDGLIFYTDDHYDSFQQLY